MEKLVYILADNFILKGLFQIVTNIYVTIGKIYSLLSSLAFTNYDENITRMIEKLSSVIYVLVGIFMLFRITVTFINMLIDPDKVSDKQAGATAIIKRVFISVVLLLVFNPSSSYVFNLLDEVETAVLGTEEEKGLIGRLTEEFAAISIQTKENSLLLENVKAETFKSFDCYYYLIENESKHQGQTSAIFTDGFYYKITITDNPNANGAVKILHPKGENTAANTGYKWYTIFHNGEVEDINGQKITLGTFPFESFTLYYKSERTINNPDYKDGFTSCPTYIIKNGTGNENSFSDSKENKKSGYEGALSSLSQIIEALDDRKEESNVVVDTNPEENKTGLNSTELKFAQNLLKNFIDPVGFNDVDEGKKYLEENTSNLLYNTQANEDIYELSVGKNATLNIQSFLALLVGIVVAIYLVFLCVDVVVRNLKLLLLKVMAPIPIICYIDPKDKIFNAWIKMYFSTYVDIFIKLIAINLSIELLQIVMLNEKIAYGWSKLFFIFGVFIFAKAIPTIISKIFGIDISSGSFKEIGKIAKTALTTLNTGVGTVLGAGAGLITGAVAGAAVQGNGFKKTMSAIGTGLKSGVSGGLRGLGSGYKGKVMGGATSIIVQNRKLADANRAGASALGMFGAGLAQKFGFRDAYEVAKADYDANKQLVEDAKATENMALDIANKQAGNITSDSAPEFINLAQARQNYQHAQATGGDVAAAEIKLKDAEKAAREKVINDTINGNISSNSGYNTDKYKSSYTDAQKLIHSIQVSDDQAKSLGNSMFEEDQNGTKKWNKGRRDNAESKQLEAQARMNKTQADHEAAQRNNG